MKKTLGRIKRTISVLLAAAMMMTALPQASVPVYAAEVQSVPDDGGVSDTAKQGLAGENASDGAVPAAGTSQDEAASGAQGDPEEKGQEGSTGTAAAGDGVETDQSGVSDAADADKTQDSDGTEADQPQDGDGTDADRPQDGDVTDVDKPQDGDGTEADRPQDGDGTEVDQPQDGDVTDADGALDGDSTGTEEQEPGTDADETLADDAEKDDLTAVQELTTEETPGEGEEVKKIDVKIALPYYEYYDSNRSGWRSCLEEFSYAVGEDVEFTPVAMEDKETIGKYTVTVPVEAGGNLRFKLACRDNMRLKDVSWKAKDNSNYGSSYSNSNVMEETDGVYVLEVKEQNDQVGNVGSYEVDINALQIWNITFVDLYARDHDGTPSVEICQTKRKSSENDGYEEEEFTVTAGQAVTVDSEEWLNGWEHYPYYTVKPKEGFTFDGMATTAAGITIRSGENYEGSTKTTQYWLEKNGREPRDITVFVTAAPTAQKTVTINMPSEVKDGMQVSVWGKGPSQTQYEELALTDGTASVRDDMEVYVQVTSQDRAYMVQATYQENGEAAEPFAESDVRTDMEVTSEYVWMRRYTLGAMNQITDGIMVNLSRAATRQVKMTVDWTAVSSIHVSEPYDQYYYSRDGEPIVYVPEGEALKFYVETQEGKGTASVSAEDGQEIGIAGYDKNIYGNNEDPYYSITPAADRNLSVKGREYEYRFQYSEDNASILVYETKSRDGGPEGDPLELTDNCYRSNGAESDSYLWIMATPKAGREISSVWYNDKNDDRRDVEHNDWYDKTAEDGSKSFCYGPIDKDWAADKTITIEGSRINTVTFQTENDISFREMSYEPDGDYFETGEWIEDSVTVREGKTLYFRVTGTGYNSNTQRLRISMTGMDRDSLKSRWEDPDMQNYLIYYFVPTVDTTITFAVEERKQCEVVVEKGDQVKSFYAGYDGEGTWDEVTAAGTYQVREDGYFTVSEIIPAGSDAEAALKRGKVTYQIGEETYDVSPEYDPDSGEVEPVYRIKVTDSMKIRIDVQDIVKHTLSIRNTDQLENISVWRMGTYKDKDNLYRADSGTAVLDDIGFYYVDFQPKDGAGVGSVILKESAGSEKVLARSWLEEDSEMGYRIGMIRGDTEIVPETVPGYTVKFDLSKLSAEDAAKIEIYNSYMGDELIVGQQNQQDIGSRKLSAAASESSSFYFGGWERYRLTLDSDLFTLTKALQSVEYSGEDYVFVISPKQTAGLPPVVTVSLERYAEHQVTLDYSDTIRSVRLEDMYGAAFKPAENQTKVYTVYGEGAVLYASAIAGYSPVVKMKGSAEGAEATELTPYRIDDRGGCEYYLGELTEDKTVQVTAVRSAQRKTYYKVGFLSEGGHVTVRDAAYGTRYTVNNEEAYYNADYSVLKGTKISFRVEPAFGYELKGVYANGQKIGPFSGQDVYEVTPVSETKIRIDVAKIVPKYPITFSWTNADAVKGVQVQGYELQNNRINVAAGEKVSFSVELTDTKYSVTSVTMNGQEVPYSAVDGLYTLTALETPMNVEIKADVADKVVRFSNTLENATYEVETNELIRLRNENTYLASGNADLLKFKVSVPDKATEVGVTYTNLQDVKEVLKEKEKTDLGEQGLSYSYEIAVAQLPLDTEIVISGAIPAGDKTALQNAVTQYETYRKSDYTEETWAVFEQALKDAQDCVKKENATQEEIDTALGRLQRAAEALVKKGGTPEDPDDPDDPGPNVPDGLWIRNIPDVTYSGAAYKPAVKVYHGRTLLTEKKDYTVSYKNNVKAGKAVVTVNGKGNYKAKDTAQFNILKKDINDEDIIIEDVCAVIKPNGTVANPKVTVRFGKKTLKANSDYKVVYPDLERGADGKIVPKTYRITISTEQAKKKGSSYVDAENFTGTREIDYTVCPEGTLLMSSAKITLDRTKVDYAGEYGINTVKPQVTGVKIGRDTLAETDYTVSYENWDQAGKATVTVTAVGTKYFGRKSVTYTVNGTKLTAGQLEITGLDPRSYTGQPVYVSDHPVTGAKGTMTVKTKADGKTLTEGTDYTVSYKTGKAEGAHTNAGTVNVTITGINGYSGTVKKSFKITPFDLADYSKAGSALTFEVEGDKKAKYTKNGAKPAFTLLFDDGESRRKLAEKTDFTVSYAGNTKIGSSASMTIRGKGCFTGTITYQYEVTAASESDVYATAVDIAVPDQFKKLKTTVKVVERETGKALKAGTDYDKNVIYYADAACTTQITAENFTGLNLGVDSRVYAKVTLKADGCYAGAAGAAPGEKVAVFRLYDKDKKVSVGSKFTVEVKTGETAGGAKIGCDQKGNPIYTGKPIEPKVVVTPKGGGTPLVEGTDYEVTYSSNVNKGKAAVTVTAVGGGYGGSKTVKFTIVPSDMSWAEKAKAAAEKTAEIFSRLMIAE